MINCPECGWVPMNEDELPLLLPDVAEYEPTDDGESPLAKITDWVNCKCPKCGQPLEIMRGVEVGHIFKLGTKYSESMGATFLDQNGKSQPIIMGCYGIGVERTAAAIIEQHHDENGIKWPLSVAPYHVIVVPVNMKKEEQVENAEKIYKQLESIGVETILDDRNERPGFKFKDAELIGIPMRITVGKDIVDGKVEFVLRETGEKELIALEDIEARVREEFKKKNVRL